MAVAALTAAVPVQAKEPGALENLVKTSEIGKVLYINGPLESEDFAAARVPFLKVGREFPVYLNLIVVDRPDEYASAAAVSMDILDAVNLLAKAIGEKVEYQQSQRFQFGIGMDINQRVTELKPDVFLYATFRLFE